MPWDIRSKPPITSTEVLAEWKRALADKTSTEPAAWQASATLLRSLAATLRDGFLPLSAEHRAMASLVDEISTHLPERRTDARTQ